MNIFQLFNRKKILIHSIENNKELEIREEVNEVLDKAIFKGRIDSPIIWQFYKSNETKIEILKQNK